MHAERRDLSVGERLLFEAPRFLVALLRQQCMELKLLMMLQIVIGCGMRRLEEAAIDRNTCVNQGRKRHVRPRGVVCQCQRRLSGTAVAAIFFKEM